MNYIITNILQPHTDQKKVKPDASGVNIPDAGGSHNGTVPGKSGTLIGRVPAGADNTGKGFMNQNSIGDKHIEWVYTTVYGYQYGTYDSTKDLIRFKSFGLSLWLFIFSVYLFYVAARLYHKYFYSKEKNLTYSLLFFVVIANILWVWIVLEIKGIPNTFLLMEFLHYPDQFTFVIELSSLLLFTIGVLRFTLIAFLPNSEGNEKTLKDSRFSIIGIVTGILSVTANIIKYGKPLKNSPH